MRKILIVNGQLVLGGAEKLTYELATFAQKNNIEPTILILENYQKEYYDDIFKQKKIKVVRTRLTGIKNFRSPLRMCRSLYWSFKLKFFAGAIYESIHVIGLYNIYRAKDTIIHNHRFFWHITNAIQGAYNFPESYFDNANDTIVYINPYQEAEFSNYEKSVPVKCKKILFKLFLND
ncbi:hypothetical protein ACEN9X_16710 [Mucilaginibacter sp. Mucisp86]|uniref:hypothetical protein n=1 Tax=Mucilaginibacter sp. Mucisp86 TaxID=3243060 RepID=UPI0039B56ADC